ncbi:hypothetical protein MKX01_016874 [Papaver californicum]|nr:hypothetical protein MKX01_016874 [Papaver californicum]
MDLLQSASLRFSHNNDIKIDIDGGGFDGGFSEIQKYLSSKCVDSLNHMKTSCDDLRPYTGWKKPQYFHLRADQKYRKFVHEIYIPYIKKQDKRIQFENRGKYIYTNRGQNNHRTGESWSRVSRFEHPSTFGTINVFLNKRLNVTLKNFVSRKKYYTSVGRSWKRRYLLYGPPGTGKASLIATIANYLKFDIYDMELTAVKTNTDLRNLLIATKSKLVIVIEDIDCSLDISNREKETNNEEGNTNDDNGRSKKKKKGSDVSLSGVLNFVDGLWSSCGGERLIIFTTNHKEKLDPALLRPGRMDKHTHLSFCDFESFKVLAINYLQIKEHEIMNEVKELLKFVRITPADVAEFLMKLKKRLDLIKKEDTIEQNDKEAAIKQEKEETIDNSENMNLKWTNDAKEEEEDHVEIDSDSDSEFDFDDSDY